MAVITPPLNQFTLNVGALKAVISSRSGASQLSQLIRSYAAILPSPETILPPLDMI